MEFIEDTGLILDSVPERRATAIEAAYEYLVTQRDMTPLQADEALVFARVEVVWWSARQRSLTHDCTIHRPDEATPETCYPDAVQVGLVAGIRVTAKR